MSSPIITPNYPAVPTTNFPTTNQTRALRQTSVTSASTDTRHTTQRGKNNNTSKLEAFNDSPNPHCTAHTKTNQRGKASRFSNAPARALTNCVHRTRDIRSGTARDNVATDKQNVLIVPGGHSKRTTGMNANNVNHEVPAITPVPTKLKRQDSHKEIADKKLKMHNTFATTHTVVGNKHAIHGTEIENQLDVPNNNVGNKSTVIDTPAVAEMPSVTYTPAVASNSTVAETSTVTHKLKSDRKSATKISAITNYLGKTNKHTVGSTLVTTYRELLVRNKPATADKIVSDILIKIEPPFPANQVPEKITTENESVAFHASKTTVQDAFHKTDLLQIE